MKPNICHTSLTAIAAVLLLFASSQAVSQDEPMEEDSKLQIEFVKPSSFTDIRPSNQSRSKYQKHVFESLSSYFNELSRTLPEGQILDVKVTNIDLAGDTNSPRIPLSSMMSDVRVMEDIYFPRLEFTYTLKNQAGEVLKTEEVDLKDMSYLNRAGFVRSSRDAFPYEHSMLIEWFQDTFEN